MAKKITQDKVVQTDLWQNTIDSTKELIKFVDSLNSELAKTTKITKEALSKNKADNFEGLKDANEDVEKLNKAFEDKIKLDKERAKLTVKLNKIEEDSAKQLVDLEIQTKKLTAAKNELIKRQIKSDNERKKGNKEIADSLKLTQAERVQLIKINQELVASNIQKQKTSKINKELVNDSLGLTDEYQKQSKRLNVLRKEYKNLILTQGKATKETNELLKEIRKLDQELKDVDASTGQFQRNVGNYPKVTETAKQGFSSLSGFLLGAFASSVNKSRDTAREFQGGLERLTNSARVIGIAFIEFAKNKAFPTIQNIFLKLQLQVLKVKESFAGLTDFFKGENEADKFAKEIKELENSIAENTKTIDESADSFENLGEKIKETDSNIVKRLELQDKLINRTAILTDDIQKLTNQEALLESQIGNSTVSFQRRGELIDELIEKQDARLSKEEELAAAELENALISIENDFIRRDLGDQFNRQNVISLNFLKDKNKADAVGIDNLNKLTAATGRINELEGQRSLNTVEANKERLENSRDLFEQELDFTLDIGDRQKSVNEIRISSDKEVTENRKKLLKETEELLNDSFKEQITLTEGFIKESLKLNEGLTDEEAISKIKDLNLERLVGLEDEKEIRAELFGAGISDEITQNRIREIIVERKAATQDVVDATNDLKDTLEEEKDLQTDILANQKALNQLALDGADDKQIFKDLEEDRTKNEIENVERRIEASTEGSIERLRLEKELTDLLLNEQDKRIKEEEEKEKKSLANQVENREKVLSVLSALNDKYFSDKLEKADEEIDSTKKRGEQLENLAAQGNANAAASLGQNQKDQAEANKKKEELLQKEKQFELALAVIAAFNTALDQPGATTGSALTEAITSTTVLTSFVASLPSFFDGTTDTGSNGSLDSNGGHMAMLHDNERVVDKQNNNKMGGISNDDAANIVHDFNNDLLSYNTPQLTIKENRFDSNEQLISKFDELKKDVVSAINNKETYLGSDIDTMKKLISQNYSKDGTRTTIKSKLRTRQ
jgi:hypothetical protein